ncbi:crossover junction endodeoxyribonuclease RuvC [bacterium]|nr:crossover junction endodeoxyribonuclease RuvC [bacterium]
MKILGIDPGMAIVGYSVVDVIGDKFSLITSGSVQTNKASSEASRLYEIFRDISVIIDKYKPDIASVEKLFYFRNQTTIIPVAQARGVIIMALEKYSIPVFEYTPMEVKQVLTGFGRADKKQVEQMVKIALGCDNLPKLDDTIDSIAIAICHTRKNLELITN